jgi:hypothetical protein
MVLAVLTSMANWDVEEPDEKVYDMRGLLMS